MPSEVNWGIFDYYSDNIPAHSCCLKMVKRKLKNGELLPKILTISTLKCKLFP